MSNEDIKNSGVEIGHAFKTFGKTFIRSAKTTADKVVDWAEDKPKEEQAPNSSVYSDGSWRKTGKELGSAFKGMGQSIVKTVKETSQNNATNTDQVEEATFREI